MKKPIKNNIGIIGQGYVGSAITSVFKLSYDIITYDKFHDAKSTHSSISDLAKESEIIFVCVPTPMKKDGTCDVSIVEEVINEINETSSRKIIVIKSTVSPGTTDRLNSRYKNIDIIFNPEFLTEANFIEDFKNQNRIILGGTENEVNRLEKIYSVLFPRVVIIKTEAKQAEMIKYFINCFLATKVSFANEMKYICDNLDLNYDNVLEHVLYDDRLGKSHWKVPGPDGNIGFGGHCLPKDLSAIISEFDTLGLLKSVYKMNNRIRENKDWEKMKDRAIVDS